MFQVDSYESLYQTVSKDMQQQKLFEGGWFCVDASPFRAALLSVIKQWSYMFNQHLIAHVTNRYADAFLSLSPRAYFWFKQEGSLSQLMDFSAKVQSSLALTLPRETHILREISRETSRLSAFQRPYHVYIHTHVLCVDVIRRRVRPLFGL